MENSYNYREKKIVAVLSSRLDPAVGFNVIGHLAISIGSHVGRDILGRPVHVDASGIRHIGISKYPFIVTKVKPGKLRKAIHEARANPALLVAGFPTEMLDTGHDDELAAAIEAKDENSMEYLGAVFYGPTEQIDAITGRFSLWRSTPPTVDSGEE